MYSYIWSAEKFFANLSDYFMNTFFSSKAMRRASLSRYFEKIDHLNLVLPTLVFLAWIKISICILHFFTFWSRIYGITLICLKLGFLWEISLFQFSYFFKQAHLCCTGLQRTPTYLAQSFLHIFFCG